MADSHDPGTDLDGTQIAAGDHLPDESLRDTKLRRDFGNGDKPDRRSVVRYWGHLGLLGDRR